MPTRKLPSKAGKNAWQAPERSKSILRGGTNKHGRQVHARSQLPMTGSPTQIGQKSEVAGRMCVDFTDLNKASPQDCYPLPFLIQDQPIRTKVISKPDASEYDCKSERVAREHNISYRPRTAVKGQILADFLIEKLETDAEPPRANHEQRGRTNQVLGRYVAKEDNMIQYLDKTKSLIQGFDRFTIRQVPRGDNKKADALSKIASTSFAHLSKQVLVEILKNKSISDMEISTVIEEQDPTWMTPIIEFISKGTLPHDQKDARRIRPRPEIRKLQMVTSIDAPFLQPWL
ncbi:reverse transcriptase domain-containing protein [Tanacetum coccineum]